MVYLDAELLVSYVCTHTYLFCVGDGGIWVVCLACCYSHGGLAVNNGRLRHGGACVCVCVLFGTAVRLHVVSMRAMVVVCMVQLVSDQRATDVGFPMCRPVACHVDEQVGECGWP